MLLANSTNLTQYLVFYFNFFRAMMNSQRKRLVVIFMKLAVFCGVCYGKEAKYKELAERIGEYIADKGLDLVSGGLETLEELFHLLSSIAIGLVPPKPIAILDIDGYYQSLIEFLIKASNEDFIDYQAIKHILISDDYQSLINKVCIELSEMGVVA